METGSLEEELTGKALRAIQNPDVNLPKYIEFLEFKKPSAKVIANAIARASHLGGMVGSATREILNAQLQIALTTEHVKAQHDMSRAANRMTWASIFLAVVSVLVAIIEVAMTWLEKL